MGNNQSQNSNIPYQRLNEPPTKASSYGCKSVPKSSTFYVKLNENHETQKKDEKDKKIVLNIIYVIYMILFTFSI